MKSRTAIRLAFLGIFSAVIDYAIKKNKAKNIEAESKRLESVDNLQKEFDFLSLVVKRFGLWSLVWGQGMTLWFFHRVGYIPENIFVFAVISIENIVFMAFFTLILTAFFLIPFIYAQLILSGNKHQKNATLIYSLATVFYCIISGLIVYGPKHNLKYAAGAALIPLILNLILYFFRGFYNKRVLLYIIFSIPPILLMFFIEIVPVQNFVTSFVREAVHPNILLVNKDYKLIKRVGFACKLDYISSPSNFYYAFSGTTEIHTRAGYIEVIIPGQKCRDTFTIPERFLLDYTPHKVAAPTTNK